MKHFSLSISSLLILLNIALGQLKSRAEVERLLLNSNNTTARSILNDGTEFTVKDGHTDEHLGIEYQYLQQTYQSIKVYNVIKTTVFKNGILQYSSGNFISDIAKKAPSATPVLSSRDAIIRVASVLKLNAPTSLTEVLNTFIIDNKIIYSNGGIAKKNIATELVWVSSDDGNTVQLAWNVEIAPLNSSDYWHIRVNAKNGGLVSTGNYTVYETNTSKHHSNNASEKFLGFKLDGTSGMNELHSVNKLMAPPPPPTVTSAQYNVIPYPSESPFIAGSTVVTNPWNLVSTGNKATTYGWHYDGSKNYNYTRGNNVYVYDDSLNQDKPGRPDTSITAIPTLSFTHVPDFSQSPFVTQNRKFAESNLFYWNNLMHDLTYQYGFTETAGNFQNNNIVRGGKQLDAVQAEAQDGSGRDNSNFSTSPDGTAPRMQMYLFNSHKIIGNNTVTISSPAGIAGNYTYLESGFSTANKLINLGAITGDFVLYNDDALGTTHLACTAPVNNIKGKIVIIDRLTCAFTAKVLNAQLAGAIAVIMVNKDSTPIVTMSGTDNTITIPAVMISITDGAKIKAALASGKTVSGTINVSRLGLLFDGDLDNGIITHEYTHGISMRLTGGPSTTSCLSNYEQGGEGWSDYVALMMTTEWKTAKTTDGTKNRVMGNYTWDQDSSQQYGFRTYPYTTDMSINKHTYKDLGDTVNNPQISSITGLVIPNATEVHYIGEVWCSVLWDMTWAIIKQEGVINGNLFDATAAGGNSIALQLVIQGLKLQPCSPGFIDARNTILAADSILYNNAHKCAIWYAFARRGMGYSASQGKSSICGDEIVAFDVPPCTLPLSLLDFSATVNNNKVNINWSTTSESSTNGFIVEYSADAINWSIVGTVNAHNLAGTNKYLLTHYQPVIGDNYYRLKMLDKDGSFKYGRIAIVKVLSKSSFSIYPNPVKTSLTAELFKTQAEKVNIKVLDVMGRVLQTKQVQTQLGNNVYQLNTSSLSKGTYLIIVDGLNKEVGQFVKD